VLLEKTLAYAQSRVGQDQQFTPHPATWFNQERFNDEPVVKVVTDEIPYDHVPFMPQGHEAFLKKNPKDMTPEELQAYNRYCM
jgi:hypothetical protein